MSARRPITATFAVTAVNDADNAGAADAGHHLVAAESAQLVADEARRLMHLEEKLGTPVQGLPPGSNLGLVLGRGVEERHEEAPAWRGRW